ncbi:MAG: PKD domain-containing protein [Alistipes sp.]|nr:PKD domain-containing protein [Alistipes sp.]
MKRVLEIIVLSVIVVITSSCNIDEVITTPMPPKIILDNNTGVYTVKVGSEIIISPSYDSVEGATYKWSMDKEVLSTSSFLRYVAETVGKYYITLTVTTESGEDREEIRIDVIDLEIPSISIAGNKNHTVAVGTSVKLSASVRETSIPTTIEWRLNDQIVGREESYTFLAESVGLYTITATATNEDGSHSDTVVVEVLNAEDMPFVWEFAKEEYHTVVGRKLLLKPTALSDLEGVTYSWQVDTQEEVLSDLSYAIFSTDTAGQYTITATATAIKGGSESVITHHFKVMVFEDGLYYRAKSANSLADWNKVLDYTPAPGQFINETKTGGFDGSQITREAAIAYAEARMSERDSNGNPNPIWVSLGGFGGYIVVGFDHSIDNSGNYDFVILGNSFSGSSEPGIVWVMQDENGNGLADDTWYELAGSETGKPETIQDYAVTYYRPNAPNMAVQWTDNLGNSGQVDYLQQFHRQEYYYPLWIEEDSYTLRGTCLAPRNYDASGNGTYWVNAEYDWGYADNFSPVDREGQGDNDGATANANHFKISNAIDCEGEPIDLRYIDFVKVQCGVNAKSGWLGEISTEVFGFYDYNMTR